MAALESTRDVARDAARPVAAPLDWRQGLAYGLPGVPLAFVALPLYVQLPPHYATQHAVPLATLGALLLVVRGLDALADPWIGRACDRWLQAGAGGALRVRAALAAVVLALGFQLLFSPPVTGMGALLAWAGACLLVTMLAYSVLTVLHQAWGARLGGGAVQQARIVGWREGLSLGGVLLASVLPGWLGFGGTATVLALLLALALPAWLGSSSAAVDAPEHGGPAPGLGAPWRVPAFRRLMLAFMVNGVASAVPATLVLFFVRDRLQHSGDEGVFLAAYFLAAALALPLWVRVVARVGLVRTWLAGMALSVAAFAWAAALGPGDGTAFLWVCLASGAALGADLAVPGALLAGVIRQAGHGGRLEGAYFGWWHFAAKANLALAAGAALPLLEALGYAPGRRDAAALQALTVSYCLLPCALKLLAAAGLLRARAALDERTPS